MGEQPILSPSRAKLLFRVAGAAAAARLVDFILVSSGLAAAAGSATFAGLMLMRPDHPPAVNGVEYLSIFAKPHGVAKPPSEPPAPDPGAIDLSPVGAIAPRDAATARGYVLVAAQWDFAWVREGTRVFAVRPGDEVARLGRIVSISKRAGRWIVAGPGGAPLLTMDSNGPDASAPRAPAFARGLIFNNK